MTSNLVLLDTDVWSHLFAVKKSRDDRIAHWRALLTGHTVAIAAQTRAELLAWPLIGRLGKTRRERVWSQLDATPTIPVDEPVIQRFARLTAEARGRGDALGQKQHTGDRWVAATALAHGAPLMALDSIYSNDPDLEILHRARDS